MGSCGSPDDVCVMMRFRAAEAETTAASEARNSPLNLRWVRSGRMSLSHMIQPPCDVRPSPPFLHKQPVTSTLKCCVTRWKRP